MNIKILGPLGIITIHKGTVLHVASYTKQSDLVLHLLRELLKTHPNCNLMKGNDVGNTILHEATTSRKLVEAAREIRMKPLDLNLWILRDGGVRIAQQRHHRGSKLVFVREEKNPRRPHRW
uniref:Ankyrin repeat-containing protein n=1 Tax=Davidia involucrata TaxID=16924 RepID=A0A5B7CB20_DAVIN